MIFLSDGVKPPPVKRKKDSLGGKSPGLNTSATSDSEGGGGGANGGGTPGDAADRKRKKARTTFTGRQIFELEKQFELKKYLSSSERAEMAKLLNVTETQVSQVFILFYLLSSSSSTSDVINERN